MNRDEVARQVAKLRQASNLPSSGEGRVNENRTGEHDEYASGRNFDARIYTAADRPNLLNGIAEFLQDGLGKGESRNYRTLEFRRSRKNQETGMEADLLSEQRRRKKRNVESR